MSNKPYTEEEIKIMNQATADCLDVLAKLLEKGMATEDCLNVLARVLGDTFAAIFGDKDEVIMKEITYFINVTMRYRDENLQLNKQKTGVVH